MAKNTSRSMNADLARGAVDGKVRFLRPDAVGGMSEQYAQDRQGVLHTQHYGSMGVASTSPEIERQRPDASVKSLGFPRFLDEPTHAGPSPYS